MNLIWHKNPDEAVRLKCRQLEEIRRKEGELMYWELVRHQLKVDPWFMMRVALQWAWLDEDLVGHSFIKHVAENWKSDLAVLFPRGHGKTLPMSAMIITAILNNPNTAILEISRTADNAKKFGALVGQHLLENDYLQRCFGRQYNPDGFLPSSTADCNLWGEKGYSLPWRNPRLDPTLLCISADAAKAGKHPDWIYLDDLTEEQNVSPEGFAETLQVVASCKMLVPPNGFFIWTGTRWHDADPIGMAENGQIVGKRGRFKTVKFSCYTDDNPQLSPTYPYKKRWNMKEETGYTHEALEVMRNPPPLGLGVFFSAQMRNDPSPEDQAEIKVADINIYEEGKAPKFGSVKVMGLETTGGGLPIYNAFVEHCQQMNIAVPIAEINSPKNHSKIQRIVACLEPVISGGKLWAQQWMIGDYSQEEGLGYELRRLRAAKNDDVIDALHCCIEHLVNKVVPAHHDDPADLYIAVDLAWSEKTRSDYTVAIAVAVDHKSNYWVIDYDRFKVSSPTGICSRLLSFYQKFEGEVKTRNISSRKYPGCWR